MSTHDSSEQQEGLGQSSRRTVTESWPLKENTLDGIYDAIGQIVSAPGAVKSIHITQGQPISVERVVGPEDDLAKFIGEDPTSTFDVVRTRAQIHEYIGQVSPHQQIWEMFLFITQQGLEVNRVLVGSSDQLSRWLAAGEANIPRVLGCRIDEEPEIPANVILVCGAPFRISPMVEVTQAIKGVMG